MAARLRELINGIKITLREEVESPGIRWADSELVEYLNDAYDFVLMNAPEANTVNAGFLCEAGTRQRLPEEATRLIKPVRNKDGALRSISMIDSTTMDSSRPNWHAEIPSIDQEYVIYDEREPGYFYVYPPAITGSNIEIIYSKPIDRHILTDYEDNQTLVRLNDRYLIALRCYVLHRC